MARDESIGRQLAARSRSESALARDPAAWHRTAPAKLAGPTLAGLSGLALAGLAGLALAALLAILAPTVALAQDGGDGPGLGIKPLPPLRPRRVDQPWPPSSTTSRPPVPAYEPPAPRPTSNVEQPVRVEKTLEQAYPFKLWDCTGVPGDLRGEAAVFRFGPKNRALKALLYVPKYYDPGRSWPLLIEGTCKGRLPLALKEFQPQAERHGFILLAVEYLYFAGQEEDTIKVWTREGEGEISHRSRTVDEVLMDLIVDERAVLEMATRVGKFYNLDRQCHGITGFLGAALAAYRLPIGRPDLFCAGIARSGDFDARFVTPNYLKAHELPIFIVYGEMEDEVTLRGSKAAMAYLKTRNLTRLQAEKIPNSGVDSRPEIAGNCFRGAVDARLGAERAAFDRAANLAGLVLLDAVPVDLVRASEGRPEASAATALAAFVTGYPQSKFLGRVKFLQARLALEKSQDSAKAEALLREFTADPLASDAAAPEAVLYLAEKIVGTARRGAECRQLLSKVSLRTDAAPAVQARIKQLCLELAETK